MKIAIVGATGNVAGRALQEVVRGGAEGIALVRHPEKVPEPLRAKVQLAQGTLEDRAFVTDETRGADALLWLTPSTFTATDFEAYTLALADNAAYAIRANGIPRVVFISSHGADREGAGQTSFAGDVEKILEAACPNTTCLRSAGFMENLVTSIESLKAGHLFGVLLPDKKYPLVTARDVGDVAARWLLDASWTGHHVRGVHGPADLSPSDQVVIMSRVLGKPIRYQPIPLESLRDAFLKRGASASVAQGYFDMFRTFAHPDYRPTEARTNETTTPTTLESFVRDVLEPIYKNATAR